MRRTSRRLARGASRPIAPAISPAAETALRPLAYKQTPMPRPGSAPSCSTAAPTAKACSHSSTPRCRLERRRPSAGAGLRAGRRRARRATRRARSSCSRRRPPPATSAPRSMLGMLYFRGRGTAKDLVQARAWLEKAAAQNDPLRALRAGPRDGRERRAGGGRPGARRRPLSSAPPSRAMPSPALRYGLALSEGNGVRKRSRGRTAAG